MSLKSIAVFVDLSPAGEARARYAVKLAMQQGAHLVGIFVVPDVWAANSTESFARGHAAISALIQRHTREEAAMAAAADRNFEMAGSRESIGYEFHVVPREGAGQQAMLRSMHVDLAIVGPPGHSGLPVDWAAEALLFKTGTPFLIVPENWKPHAVGERIAVGWNASREARRAITDSLPLLTAARSVHVVVVDAESNRRHGEEPGADIALYLSRHGVSVTVDAVASEGLSVAAALLRTATLVNADLIVMGAYSHSRVGEFIFGGVTRDLLRDSPLPLLIAH